MIYYSHRVTKNPVPLKKIIQGQEMSNILNSLARISISFLEIAVKSDSKIPNYKKSFLTEG